MYLPLPTTDLIDFLPSKLRWAFLPVYHAFFHSNTGQVSRCAHPASLPTSFRNGGTSSHRPGTEAFWKTSKRYSAMTFGCGGIRAVLGAGKVGGTDGKGED